MEGGHSIGQWEDDPNSVIHAARGDPPVSSGPGYFMPENYGGGGPNSTIDLTLPPADYTRNPYAAPTTPYAAPTNPYAGPSVPNTPATPMKLSGSVTAASTVKNLDKDKLLRMLMLNSLLKQKEQQQPVATNSITPWAQPFSGTSPLQTVGTLAMLK